MIDDTDIVTYKSDNAAREDLLWLAYIVLPNGEYWGVRFNGATEEIAKTKALATWQREQEKWKALEPLIEQTNQQFKPQGAAIGSQLLINTNDPWAEAEKQHHLAGKVWMIHKDSREKKRVALTEIVMYEKLGYERGGPRSK